MIIEFYNRLDLVNPIEFIECDSVDCTIYDLLSQNVEKLQIEKLKCVDCVLDGQIIDFALWDKVSLKNAYHIKFIINPQAVSSVVGIIIAVIAAAAAVYAYVMASKIKKPGSKKTKSQTSSIYDPNAQGNKVKLEDPIPEQFGYVKAFPDLISEYHYYYKNNIRYMDVLLCQGVGYFDHPLDRVYIGNTPITDYDKSLYKIQIAEPGEDISGHTAHNCWYQSTEVTNSGHEIVPKNENTEDKDTGNKNLAPRFSGNTFTAYKSGNRITGVDSSGPHWQNHVTAVNLGYHEEDVFEIKNMSALPDLVLRSESGNFSNEFSFLDLSYVQDITTGTKIYLPYIPFDDFADCYEAEPKARLNCFVGSVITPGGSPQTIPIGGIKKDLDYEFQSDAGGQYILLRNFHFTDSYRPIANTSKYEISVSLPNSDLKRTLIKLNDKTGDINSQTWRVSNTVIDYSLMVADGRWDVKSVTELQALEVGDTVTISGSEVYRVMYHAGYGYNQIDYTVDETHLYKITAISGTQITFDRNLPVCDSSSIPVMGVGGNQFATASRYSIYIGKQAPFNYPYRDGNGFYRVLSEEEINGATVLTLEAVTADDFDYETISNWSGFAFDGTYSCQTELLTGANAGQNGKQSTVGPFRACPRGCGARYYELDFTFPSGIYDMTDDGDYSEWTSSILIEFRPAGSNANWTEYTKSWTYATGDELGFTIAFDMYNLNGIDNPDEYIAYEFRVTNTSEYSDDTSVMQKLYWNGLKCMIADDESYPDVTVIALTIKGSETLSEASENQIATYWTRMLPNIETGELEKTCSIVPAVKYICDQSRYDDLYVLSHWLDYRDITDGAGIEFNYRFDDFTTILEAIRQVLQNGYAEPVVNGNEILPKRKVATETFTQMFSPQNIVGEVKFSGTLITEDTDNELDLTYMDGDKGDGTWKEYQEFVELDIQSNTGSKSYYQQNQNVQSVELLACTDEDSAYRIALRQLREMMYCRQEVSFKTELDALNCQYGDVVLVALPMNANLVSGRIRAIDESTNIITTDQNFTTEQVTGVIYIRRPDGSVWGGTCIFSDNGKLQLTSVLDWSISDWLNDYPNLEQPYFCFGDVFKGWVKSIKPSEHTASVTVINYSDRIFADDIFSGYGVSPYGTCAYGSK
jgi:hypothetical protein